MAAKIGERIKKDSVVTRRARSTRNWDRREVQILRRIDNPYPELAGLVGSSEQASAAKLDLEGVSWGTS